MYSSASQVAQFCTNLLSGSVNFTEDTRPTKAAVESWLSSGCSLIHSALAGAHYSTPVTAAAPSIYGIIVQLETFYGVAMAEMSRLSANVQAKERTRGQIFLEMFNDGLTRLVGKDLAEAGVSVTGTAPIHIGGISEDRKDTVEDDSDRITPAFKRGLLRFPGTVDSGEAATIDGYREDD